MFKANVIGNIHFFNLTIPLVLQGQAKKVIAISSGFADIDISAKYDLANSAPYSISKTALNMAVAKFSAQYANDGVLFMSISPGVVDTGMHNNGKNIIEHVLAKYYRFNSVAVTDEEKQKLAEISGKFKLYAPHFTGPDTAEVAIRQMLSVINRSSVKAGDGGSWVSQYGNKQWL